MSFIQHNYGTDEDGRMYIIPGVGLFDREWSFYYAAQINSQVNPATKSTFKCHVYHTIPVTKTEVDNALQAHLNQVNALISANTVEVQQTVASSFAIQIDMLAAELADIRSLLPEVDEADTAKINERLDQIDARLEALKQASGN